MELIGKSATNDTSMIGMLSILSKDFSIKGLEKSLHIITNNDWLNGLKGSTKKKNRELLFKLQSLFYNVQMDDDVKHRGIKL